MKIVFMGTPLAAVPSLEALVRDGHDVVGVYTQPDRPSGRGNRLTAPPVKDYAVANGFEIFQPLKIKTPDALAQFRSLGADVAVVVAYGRILPQTFLDAFPFGAINVHFSLLPKYRGAAPVNWAIVNGEIISGVTTMQMDAGLDTGDILLQKETIIAADENSIELMNRLSVVGADLLTRTLRELETLPRFVQDHEHVTFAPLMSKDDGRIDWNLSSNDIVNRIRGFQPFPTTFGFYDGKKVKFWKASAENAQELFSDAPGTVSTAKGDELLIVCGDNSLLSVNELQIEGKNRMRTRDFLNGLKIGVGEVFG